MQTGFRANAICSFETEKYRREAKSFSYMLGRREAEAEDKGLGFG